MKRKYLYLTFIVIILLVSYVVYESGYLESIKNMFANRYIKEKTVRDLNNLSESSENKMLLITEIYADDLDIPWEIVFLPNDEVLVTERPGRLVKIAEETTYIDVPGVVHNGEGGLLGAVLHPDYENNGFLYLYVTSEIDGSTINRVERYVFNGEGLGEKVTIIDSIPGASYHDGGRMEFGPDGYLYITTGDAGDKPSAQDLNSLAGKILRLNDDGTIPEDNPFGTAVYSYGHRNPQGLAWDDQGNLWSTEHGRSGNASGYDELNLIEKGKNYGWPEIQGDEEKEGMEKPIIHSGPSVTWAPAGLEYFDGKLYFAGLRGSALYEVAVEGKTVTSYEELLKGNYGRLRAVKKGNDGNLYLTTSNRDGRGQVFDGDDKVILVSFK